MRQSSLRRWLGITVGTVAVAGGTFAFCTRSLAQGAESAARGQERGSIKADTAQEGGLGQPLPAPDPTPLPGGGGSFQDFPTPAQGGGMRPPMMGPATMTVAQNTIYILRGNSLFAYDAATLKLKAQAELPRPAGVPRTGGGGLGGFGGGGQGGFGGGFGGGRF